jgi:ABC-type amino acid transport substrate-binding protein
MLALLSWGQLTVAQPPQAVSDLQLLLARGKLVVALVDTDYPPLFLASSTGDLEGHNISLVQDIAQALGVHVEFVRTTPSFNEIIDMVSTGAADIGLATSMTLSRAQKVLFTQPYLTLNMALLLNRRKLIEYGLESGLTSLTELYHTTQPIGVLTGSAYVVYVRKHFPKAGLKAYASLPDLLAAVQTGEVLAAVRNDLTATLYLHQHPEAVLWLQLFVDQSAKDYLAFPVRRDRPHLLAWLNTYLLLKQAHWNSSDLMEQYQRRHHGD